MKSLELLTDLPDGHPQQLLDFDQRYSNTTLLYTTAEGERHLVNYSGQEHGKIFLYRSGADLIELSVKSQPDIKPWLPAIGYYNVGSIPFYLLKTPGRQYKRSMCPGVYKLYPTNFLMRDVNSRDYWHHLVQQTLAPIYMHMDQVVSKACTDVALSREFAISSVRANQPLLHYRQYPIGNLDYESRSVIILQPALKQEVMDFFKNTGVKQWNII